MLRALLAIVAKRGLVIQQMDVKGAYLNGILKEHVYMMQPEGYDDESGHVCLLVKTLYGLKQSGREWNNELDEKLQKHQFTCLHSDPCAYIHGGSKSFEIITIWVNDLLLFASSAVLNEKMKRDL